MPHPWVRSRALHGTCAAAFAALLPWGALYAGDDDHERARQAFEAGEVMPLRAVLERVEGAYPGEILEVELDREEGVWAYEIKLLRKSGDVLELELDARDGRVLGVRGRDVRPGDRNRNDD
ncbi:PepSY domain-containing protein [Thauera sp. WH-2]|jgi:hypothetical protein|uniref:PepSY domain-containing protein n=1 Tax=unclassified Thauera TaxID=2609274 RepID=UPI003AAF0E6E